MNVVDGHSNSEQIVKFADFAALEKNGWRSESTVEAYVELFASASDMTISKILDKLELGSSVLDLCCGQGNVTQALSQAGHTVVGSDFSPAMLSRAKKRLPDVKLVHADAQDLPFADNEFEAAVCNFGIGHIPDQAKALSEVARVVRKGGKFVMTGWSGPATSLAFEIFYGCVKAYGDPSVALPEGPNFHLLEDKAAVEKLLSEANMKMLEHENVECFWQLEKPEALIEIFEKAAPRGGALLRQQPKGNRKAIADAITEQVRRRCGSGNQFHIPIPAIIVTAASG